MAGVRPRLLRERPSGGVWDYVLITFNRAHAQVNQKQGEAKKEREVLMSCFLYKGICAL